jgi:hypothetical protein
MSQNEGLNTNAPRSNPTSTPSGGGYLRVNTDTKTMAYTIADAMNATEPTNRLLIKITPGNQLVISASSSDGIPDDHEQHDCRPDRGNIRVEAGPNLSCSDLKRKSPIFKCGHNDTHQSVSFSAPQAREK